tara:strand:+ start:565 stop:1131 length:567 start_codon:yes stop_codon:yes gene_type:complete
MNDLVETIEIKAGYRYASYLDQDRFDYLKDEDWDCWGLFTVSTGMNEVNLALDTFGINERLETVMENNQHSWNDNEAVIALGKAINRAGYQYKFLNLGYSPWHYLVAYWDPKLLLDPKGVLNEFSEWYEGNVFTISLEKLEVYESLSGSTIEQWETVESVGQVIFTDNFQFSAETCQELLGASIAIAA